MRFARFKTSTLSVLVCLAVAGCWKSSEERAAEHFESGIELASNGDTDRALVEFRNTLKYDNDNADAFRQMAQIYLDRGNRRAAYRNFLGVVEKLPEDLEGRKALSMIAFQSQSWDEFERHSEVAIRLAPDDPEIKTIEAAAQYRKAVLEEDSALRATVLAQAEVLAEEQTDSEILRQILIDGYVAQEKFDSALVELEKSIAASPQNLQLYNAKLELLARLGRRDELETELRRMVELFPEEDTVKATLMRFFMARGEPDKAEEFLRSSIDQATTDEDRAARYASLIQFLLRIKGPEAALTELDEILAATPGLDTLRALRGTIKFDSGQRSEGIAELQDLLGAETTNLTKTEKQGIQVALARMLSADGNDVGARKLVEEVLAEDPNSVGALKMQAVWMIRDDQTDEAISALRLALDQAPQDVEAMTIMAQAYERAGNTPLMLEFLSLAVETSGNAPDTSLRYAAALVRDDKALQAESILINALRITPGHVELLGALGQIYLELDDMPRAQQVVDTLRDLDGDIARNSADALELEVLSRTVGTDEALGFLENLANQAGATGDQAKLALLQARLRSADSETALSLAKDLVAENPGNLQFQNALALTHATLRQFDEAEAVFAEILQAEPRLVSAWVQLARVHVAQGEHDQAVDVIDQGLAANEAAPDLLWAKASYLQRNGDIDGAIDIYEGLYERFSGSPVIANNLASLLSTYRPEDPAALERAQVIAQRLKNTDVPAFQDTYGWLQHLAGNSQTALSYLEAAAAGLPNELQVQVHLGLIYAALARNEDALAQLQKAVSLAGPLGDKVLLERAQAKIAELKAADDGTTEGSDQN